MLSDRLKKALTLSLLLGAAVPAAAVQIGVGEGTNIAVAADTEADQLILDLYGRLWRAAMRGGMARPITGPELRLSRPDVGPDGTIVAEGDDGTGQKIWLVSRDGDAEPLTEGPGRDAAPRWHPSGERIVFASDRMGSWDLYELDIAGGTPVRLTSAATDEMEPAVSNSGERLVWITRSAFRWELWTRTPDSGLRLLYSTSHPLAAPSIRPDDSVVVVVEDAPGDHRLTAVILSDPAVVKPLATGEDFFHRPVDWLDRNRLVYTADGRIRLREFGELRGREIPWTAWISAAGPRATEPGLDGTAPLLHHGRYVIRAGRVFDGVNAEYRRNTDVLVVDDRIAAVTARQEWPDTATLEFPDAVVMPGLIQLGLADGLSADDGVRFLACGVTTIVEVASTPGTAAVSVPAWNDGSVPGPALVSGSSSEGGLIDVRPIRKRTTRSERIRDARARGAAVVTNRLYPDLADGASLLGADTLLPTSPSGRRYADIRRLLEVSGARLIADGTDDVANRADARGSSGTPLMALLGGSGDSSGGVLSRSNCAVRRQIEVLQSLGTPAFELLIRYTSDSARIAGLSDDRGALVVDSRADLLLVNGDPLTDAGALAAVQGVVAGGRFLTPAGLLPAREPRDPGVTSENLTIPIDSGQMSPESDTFDISGSGSPGWHYPPAWQ